MADGADIADLDAVFSNLDSMVSDMLDVGAPAAPVAAASSTTTDASNAAPAASQPASNDISDIMESVNKLAEERALEEAKRKEEEAQREAEKKKQEEALEQAKQAALEQKRKDRALRLAAANAHVDSISTSIASAVGKLVEDLKSRAGMYVERTKDIVTSCSSMLAEAKARSDRNVDEEVHKALSVSSQMLYDRLNLLVKAAKDSKRDETQPALQALAACGFQVLVAVKELHGNIVTHIAKEFDFANL